MSEKREIFKDGPLIMGVLNTTPDSFSDNLRYADAEAATTAGLEMIAEGADILDVGGESSRPGSRPVSPAEELSRVLPVIEALASRTDVPISVDTVKPEVAAAALDAGACMVNDVSNLQFGDELARAVAERGAFLVLMHTRGTPQNMTRLVEYDDVVRRVCEELQVSVEKARDAGVPRSRIWVDPGIGFAKTASQSIELLARLDEIVDLGYPVLVGPSRKSFIGEVTGAPVHDRLGGTAAAVTASILHGARAVRVHDVRMMRQALMVAAAARVARVPAPLEGREGRLHV